MSFKTPILLLTFNRLDTTKVVLEKIKIQKPQILYIASDGPRQSKPGEKEVVEKIRAYVLSQIDWECNIKTLFLENNIGCKLGVSNAISWFFKDNEMGIILEDDCVPSESFFYFCEDLLIKYKNDDRVWHIDGSTFQVGVPETSYQFSKYCLIWGWATWSRAWSKYDPAIKSFPDFKKKNIINSIWDKNDVKNFWLNNLEEIYINKIDTWDFQWMYTVWTNNGMSIRPAVNMIKNIGFNADATHTFKANKLLEEMKNNEIDFPLNHPLFFLPNNELDDICSYTRFEIHKHRVNPIKRFLKRLKLFF